MSETDPKPARIIAEGNWFFRRILTFATAIAVLGLVAWIIALVPAELLPGIAYGLLIIHGLTVIAYLLGPTAEHITGFAAALKALVERKP